MPVLQVPQGDTISIRISDSKGTETNEIKLFINDQLLTTLNDDESRFAIEKDGETDNYLVIADARPDDIGRYTVEFNGELRPICMLEVTPARVKVSQAEIPVKQVVVEELVEEEQEQQPAAAATPQETTEEIPTHEVVEGDTVNLTIERPIGTDAKEISLSRNDEKLPSNSNVTVKPLSSTATEITLANVKLTDEGLYAIQISGQPSQKLMKLKVLPKPVVHDSIHLPKDVFEQGETLTIQCEFDQKPDETLVWKFNDQPLNIMKDERIIVETTDDGKSYTLTVKDLRSAQDQGVYKLENSHLVLETPFIRVIEHVREEEEETTILFEDEETETFELQRKPKKDTEEEKVSEVE